MLVPLLMTSRSRSNVTTRCAGRGTVVVVCSVVDVTTAGNVAVVDVAATVVDVDAAVVGAVINGAPLVDLFSVVVVTFFATVSRSGFPPEPSAIDPNTAITTAPTTDAAITWWRRRTAWTRAATRGSAAPGDDMKSGSRSSNMPMI